MNDDNDATRPPQYIDVVNDYAAARKLGAEPPEIPHAYLTGGNGLDVMMRWLIDHDMIGAHARWLAEHGTAMWCPDWCQSDHGPVQVIDPEVGISHDHEPLTVGHVTGIYSRFDCADGQREEYITIDGDGLAGFDGHMQIPLAAVDQVIEALRSVPRPG